MSRTSTPLTRSASSSSDSSDTTMLDVPTVPLTPTRPRQPSLTTPVAVAAPAPTPTPAPAPAPAPTLDPTFSLLLSLPRELRDRVYSFALTSAFPFWWPGTAPVAHDIAPALLRTSKRIHAESAALLYTANTFLFTHPSDCTVFRVVASPSAARIATVYLRIRDRDLPLWTKYLGSNRQDRCLSADLPALKELTVFLRLANPAVPRFVAHLAGPPPHLQLVIPPHLQPHLHPHHTHLAVLPTGAPGLHHPPPPPPPPFANFAAAAPQPPAPPPPPLPPHPNHTLLASFLRHDRDTGIESLCLSLRDALTSHTDPHTHHTHNTRTPSPHTPPTHTPPHVNIICILRLPRPDLARLLRLYPDELTLDRNGDARTTPRRLHGADVCLEFGPVDPA